MSMSAEGGGAVALNVENKSKILGFLWVGFYSAILALFTLTLFRFWARTIVRRRLWADTTIGGEPLEYTGRGMELFIGFLIAIFTVMLPLVGALLAAQFFLDPIGTAVVFVVVYLLLFILVGVAIFLARRYQLSRTLWRGVRFEQKGSPWAYGLMAFLYGLLTVITFGWFGPAMRLRLEKRLWGNAYFGDMPFEYDNSPAARTEPVYLSYVLAIFGVVLFYAGLAGGMYWLGLFEDPTAMMDPMNLARFYGIFFAGVLVLIFFVAWHEAAMIRQITKSISIGGVSLRSKFSAWDLIQLALTNVLLVVFTLGFGVLAAQMRVWRKICRRIEVDGTLELARIHQAATRGPKSGEGMADAFDLSGGV
jgi:uncharacterized membrane protein YjgN (DUF898 family)